MTTRDEREDAAEEDDAAEEEAPSRGPLPPPQGMPHAVAGFACICVGIAIVLLFGRNPDLEERHATYFFAAVWMLFGAAFARLGIAGAIAERQARMRRERDLPPWLLDRDWRPDGARPIAAERVLPNLRPLLFWIAFLTPFHTIWRLPPSWWGIWIAVGILDLIALATAALAIRRIWGVLRAGRCFLRWQTAPTAPAHRFEARFESSRTLGATGQAKMTLRCLRDPAANRRIGEEAAADAEEIWSEKRSFPVNDRPEGGSWVQFSFDVPADARGTRSSAARPIRWILTVEVPTTGPDLRTAFPVPIYDR